MKTIEEIARMYTKLIGKEIAEVSCNPFDFIEEGNYSEPSEDFWVYDFCNDACDYFEKYTGKNQVSYSYTAKDDTVEFLFGDYSGAEPSILITVDGNTSKVISVNVLNRK